MSGMEPTGKEQDEEQPEVGFEFDQQNRSARDEHSARSFFALISFFIAIIFLAIFISKPLSSISGLVVLLAIFAFGLGGIYLLTRKPAPEHSFGSSTPLQNSDESEEAPIVDSTLVDQENEDEQDTEDDELNSF